MCEGVLRPFLQGAGASRIGSINIAKPGGLNLGGGFSKHVFESPAALSSKTAKYSLGSKLLFSQRTTLKVAGKGKSTSSVTSLIKFAASPFGTAQMR